MFGRARSIGTRLFVATGLAGMLFTGALAVALYGLWAGEGIRSEVGQFRM